MKLMSLFTIGAKQHNDIYKKTVNSRMITFLYGSIDNKLLEKSEADKQIVKSDTNYEKLD